MEGLSGILTTRKGRTMGGGEAPDTQTSQLCGLHVSRPVWASLSASVR